MNSISDLIRVVCRHPKSPYIAEYVTQIRDRLTSKTYLQVTGEGLAEYVTTHTYTPWVDLEPVEE